MNSNIFLRPFNIHLFYADEVLGLQIDYKLFGRIVNFGLLKFDFWSFSQLLFPIENNFFGTL